MNDSKNMSLLSGTMLAGVLGVIGNLALLFIGKPFVGGAEFGALSTVPVILWSVLGVIGAAVTFMAARKFSSQPDNLFTIIAGVVLVLSFIPDLLVKMIENETTAGVSWSTVVLLMFMHVVSASAVMWVFLHKVRSA